MSPQTGDGPDTTDYANEATERELREDTFVGIDQNGYVPLGTFESVGQGTGLTTETSGSSEQSALLPDADTTVDGGFAFEVAIEEIVNEEGIVWIDPDIATGYVYQATQT